MQDCYGTRNESGADITGFSILSSARITLHNCHAQRNNSMFGSARGFLINSSSEIKLIHCESYEHNAATSQAVGIDLVFSTNCLLKANHAVKNTGSSNANSFGFRVSPTAPTGNNVFLKNIAMQNGVTVSVHNNQFNGFAANQQNVQTAENSNTLSQPWTNVGFV